MHFLKKKIRIWKNDHAHLVADEEHRYYKFYGEILENPQGHMYAAFRAKKKRLFFRTSWDLSRYKYISLYGMGDARTYFLTLQTTSFPQFDLYQMPFTFKTPGKWETICVPLNAFYLKVKSSEMSKHRFSGIERIQTVGISLLNPYPGPFELYIRWIKTMNEIYNESDTFELSTEQAAQDINV
ncbi:uncharacterized protein T551_02389 [Pneumocystis jirovecii RU7]|uniref:NADH:ubiquinone oxidoreductase intermediate-associated protein 30 domain-containing protein n=1 Tax=Pneumocystis jirovecii (strain RU7) TaxID=1408657 RepID=A0A0W4ZL54_PNEJ7|nr:uncharacterized protein T551_02389 [Pneumocystis jirovecii RU7]KTW29115.1 hypothetical protein T551_02389 [Pneumocystis jirovecii RU7]